MSYVKNSEIHAGPGAIAAIDAVTPVRRRLRQKQMVAFKKRDQALAALPAARHRMMLGALGPTHYTPSPGIHTTTAPPGRVFGVAGKLMTAPSATRLVSGGGPSLPGGIFPGRTIGGGLPPPTVVSSSGNPVMVDPTSMYGNQPPPTPIPGAVVDPSSMYGGGGGGGGDGAGVVTPAPVATSPSPTDDGSTTALPDPSDLPASGGMTPTLWIAAGAAAIGLFLLLRHK